MPANASLSNTPASFYVVGATVPRDAPSYIVRKADNDLLEGLRAGQFCYVLDTRQMGKSSLMVRTAARLKQEGVAVVILDLTELGQNLSIEQWYYGLLHRLGKQSELTEPLIAFWQQNRELGPLQRWLAAIQQMALPGLSGPLVIFVDEIDAVRSLPFSTDELFAGIRACYNRRAEDPALERLTFCLLGVATPADLIRDVRTTPFNIGRRIELSDFTAEEAEPLSEGLSGERRDGSKLLERVLYWTGGHPYLTQRLCQWVAQDPDVTTRADVDRVCKAVFLSGIAREVDDNLAFVRNRILRSEADVAGLLDLYAQVRVGRKRMRDDGTNPLVSILRLSGIVRLVGGALWVRNRIYHRVFDRNWILDNMPDAERRRQRTAYRQGLLRATLLSSVVLAVLGGAVLKARMETHRANTARYEAQQNSLQLRELLSRTQVERGVQLLKAEDSDGLLDLLEACRTTALMPEEYASRAMVWSAWQKPYTGRLIGVMGHQAMVTSVAFSPDGKRLATASDDNTARLWDVATGQPIGPPLKHEAGIRSLAFSPDGKRLATASWDTARLWDVSVSPVDLHEMELRTWVTLNARLNQQGLVEAIPWQEWQKLRGELQQWEAKQAKKASAQAEKRIHAR